MASHRTPEAASLYTFGVYCPHCGVKNDRGESECYICGKRLPSLTVVAADTPQRPQRKVAEPAESLATVGDRALALLFDRGVIVAVMIVLVAWQTARDGAIDPRSRWIAGSGIAIFAAAVFLYHFLLEAAFRTTLGKAMMGLRVQTSDRRGRVVAAALRNVLRIADAQILYLIGFLSAVFTRQRQRIGDIAAGTVVMERRNNARLRGGMMLLWLVIVVGALLTARSLCPTCSVTPWRGLRPALPSSPATSALPPGRASSAP